MVPKEPAIAGKICLVLDDEFLIALDIQQILESAGAAQVVCFGNASECAVALERGDHFDLAILDYKLGADEKASLSVAAILHARGIPFIFVTGMRHQDIHSQEFPHAIVVEKPYDVPALLHAIRRALKS